MTRDRRLPEPAESDLVVLASGLVSAAVGLVAVVTAIGLGYVAAAGLGLVLLLLAWKVPTAPSARAVRYLVFGLGVLAFIGAVYDLLA
ncbi:MAG TPA: hypothetical protein VFE15_12135 [Marmoricola sp.]|nr:hypothetical protein [Marmoricola sp.]